MRREFATAVVVIGSAAAAETEIYAAANTATAADIAAAAALCIQFGGVFEVQTFVRFMECSRFKMIIWTGVANLF